MRTRVKGLLKVEKNHINLAMNIQDACPLVDDRYQLCLAREILLESMLVAINGRVGREMVANLLTHNMFHDFGGQRC